MTRRKREGITQKNIFDKPHYKSIIRLLIEYQDKKFQGKIGLKTIHFRYALEKNYRKSTDSRVKSTIKTLEPWFEEKLIELYNTKAITSECITSKQNLAKFLNNLERPPIKIIYKIGQKPDVRYYLKKEVYNEGIRLENKDAIDFCPQRDIRYVPIKNKATFGSEYRVGGHVIYGLSDEIYNSFDDKDKDFIQNGLKKINRFLDKLYELKTNKHYEEKDERLQKLLNSTNSNEIKRFIKKDGDFLYGEIYNGVVINQDTKHTLDITESKKYFFVKFGFPFLIFKELHYGEPYPRVFIRKELIDAQNKYFYNKRPKNESVKKNFDKYAQIWSNVLTEFCDDAYSFTLEEIEEMLQWGWDNLDFFIKWKYLGIMYSRYDLYEKNGLTKLFKIIS